MAAFFRFIQSFVVRDLLKNYVRTTLTIFGIGLGVAVMLAINLANATAFARFEQSIDLVAGRTNLQINSSAGSEFDQNLLKDLQFLWSRDAHFTPLIDQLAIVPGKAPDVVQVLGVDMFADPEFRPFSISGKEGGTWSNDIFNQGFAYVGAKFAEKYHLAKGSQFHLLINDREEMLKVADVLAYSGPGRAFGGSLVVMDIGPAQKLFAMDGRINRIDIIVPEAQVMQIAHEVRAHTPNYLITDRPQRRGAQVQKMIAAFQYNLAALSLIALLVGMFLIYNTMSITIIRKRTEIGILRALGMSRGRVFGVFLTQALFLGVSGSALGVAGGLVFARGAVKAVSATVQSLYIDQPAAEVGVNYAVLELAFAVGVALTAIAALGPIFEAMSVSAAEATRRASYEYRVARGAGKLATFGIALLAAAALFATLPAVSGFPVYGYASAALIIFGTAFCTPLMLGFFIKLARPLMFQLFGTEGRLAILSLGGTIGRTSVTVASLMIGISMMVSLAIMIGSFRQTVIVWVNQTLRADLYVEPLSRTTSNRAGRLTNETVARIRQLPGVDEVDAFVDLPIEYRGSPTNLGAGDLGVLMRHGQLLFVDGEPSLQVLERVLKSQGGTVISESFAIRNNVKKGETLMLPSPSGAFPVKVEGIYYDYASDSGYIIIPRTLYDRHFPDLYSTTLGVYVKRGADLNEVRSQMLQQLGNSTRLSVRTNRELRSEVLRVFDNTFSITYALHTISILIAILGVMNALFALTFELRREFAILSYLGASMKQLRKIVLLQAGALGLLGNVAGVTVGFVLSLLLINVINKQSFGWTVQLTIPVQFLIQSFLLIMGFSIASGILPARAATRNISPEAVRFE